MVQTVLSEVRILGCAPIHVFPLVEETIFTSEIWLYEGIRNAAYHAHAQYQGRLGFRRFAQRP